MKVRLKTDPEITGYSNKFNTHGLGEIIVTYEDGEKSSEYLGDYEVQLKDETWVDMKEAFRDHTLVSDNYSEYFREAQTDEEKQRGWYL